MLTSTLSKGRPFVDIRNGIELAYAIVDTVRHPLVVLDQDLRVIAASRSFYQTFRLVREDVRGHLLYAIDGGQWDIQELRELLETISSDQATVEGYEVERGFPAIGHCVMLLNARKAFYEKGVHSTLLLAFEDMPSPAANRVRQSSFPTKPPDPIGSLRFPITGLANPT
jgi:PAS domain-containing protein